MRQKRLYHLVKRVFDAVCALLGLLLLALPMLLIALIVALDSPGPAIFRQERLGLNGKPFMIYKFRTMRLDAEANGPALGGGLRHALHPFRPFPPAHPAG